MTETISEPPDLRTSRRRKPQESSLALRLPPHDLQTEMGVLGCQLIDPTACILEVMQKIHGDVTAHYDLRHQEIQRVLFEMADAMKPVDIITVQSALKDKSLLDQVGGITYLSQLQDIPSAANLPAYLDKLCEKHVLRKAVALCTNAVGRIYDFNGDADELMDQLERDVLALRTQRGDGSIKPIREHVNAALLNIERMFEQQGKISGLSTGFRDIDMETDGLHPADYIVIGGFPSDGKTTLALNIAEHVSIELDLPVGVFSAEMSAVSLVKRSIASLGRVNMRDIRDGRMTESDFPRVLSAAKKISNSKLFIDDTSDMTIQQLRAKARRMAQQHGVKLIIADYAQLFSSPGAENRTNEIDQVSKGFKNMAKELNIPVILLSQLTEDAKGGVHLKGARALGEDADGYWEIKKPKGWVVNPAELGEPKELWLRKQRNEARGVCVNLMLLKGFTRFESASKIEPETEYRSATND